jgi:hypothetical protein
MIQDQHPQRDDTYAPAATATSGSYSQKPSTWVQSHPLQVNAIGSICFDASTGEYKYYQDGVHIGNVDKAHAESLSKDWPVCPGTAMKSVMQGTLPNSLHLNQRNGGNTEKYVTSVRSYNSHTPSARVYERQPIVYQPTVGYQGEGIRYSNRGYQEVIPVQPNSGYENYTYLN